MKALRVVTDAIKNKKSSGLDNIPSILWKDYLFHPYLLNLYDHDPGMPIQLESVRHRTRAKEGRSIRFYYRGINLTAIASKIYNKFIFKRLVLPLDRILRRNQKGFRRGRSTISQILALRRIIEEIRNSREKTLVFVDFKNHLIPLTDKRCS